MLRKLVSCLKRAWVFRRQQPSTEALCPGDADVGALVAEDCDRLICNGRAALAGGDLMTATSCYRDAVARAPGNPAFRVALAFVLTEQGRYEEAWPQLDEAVRLRPDDPDIHLQRGNFQCEVGELENARWCYLEALALRPGHVEVHANLGHVLIRQGALTAAIASFEYALLHDSGHLRAHSNLLLALTLQSDGLDGSYVREARRYGEKVAVVAKPYREWLVSPPAAGVPRALRVGFVSGDLRCHAVMAVLEGILRQLDRARIELVAYSMNPLDDEVTERVKGYFSQWTPVTGMSDEALAQRIHADRVDILIDLAGHSAHNRLPVFAWKPAPVQVSWLGYLASTGVPGMDYVLADPVCAPESAQAQFTEEIWHLPETLNCYTPPAEHPQLAVAALPALRNGYITFGSFQRINKISDATVGAWARILNLLPQATLRLRNEVASSESARGQLQLRLTQAGIAAERVTYGGNIPGREEYLAAYGEVDIILDTFPYPGVTTTCEALWMGVPTVTLARGAVLGRIGASVLTCAGLTDWVASSEEEYVNLAVRHGSDVTGLARLRAGLRQRVRATPLFDASRFAPQLENALIAMWQRKMKSTAQPNRGDPRRPNAESPPTSERAESEGAAVARLGRVALARGDLMAATRYYVQALQHNPGDTETNVALGYVFTERGMYSEARPYLEVALRTAPENADAWYLLGKVAHEERDLPAVLNHFSRALDARPEFDAVFGDLAKLDFSNREHQTVTAAILSVIRDRPARGWFYHSLGDLYDRADDLANAVASYREALALQPANAITHCNLGHVFLKLGDFDAAGTHLRRALAIKPDYFTAHSNLLWMLSFHAGDIAAEYVAEARRYGEMVRGAAQPFTDWKQTSSREAECLRVGIVSADLRAHPIGYFLEGILKNLNPARLKLMVYSMNPQDDEMTARIKPSVVQWTSISGLTDAQAAHKIHDDRVDILIDPAGHSGLNRMPVFAWKPAPLQVSWFGYLASTGVPGMDYVLADAVAAPTAVQSQFTEEIWHLPETFNCYTPPPEHPLLEVAAPPALRNGYVTFGSCQRLNKLGDDTLALWGRVLQAVPLAKLRLQNGHMGHLQSVSKLQKRMAKAGISPDRCILQGAIDGRENHLAAHSQVDIILDTVEYPGTTTTCEALWMGVPTLTLAGDTLLTRVGASVLTCAGLEDWVASSEDEYVALAARHAADIGALEHLRARLRRQVAATALFDARRFAPQLEAALFAMWRRKKNV